MPFRLFDRLTGLGAQRRIRSRSSREISGRPVPAKYRRQRSQLVDAMLDGHFYFGGKQDRDRRRAGSVVGASAAGSPKWAARSSAAVTTTQSPVLERVPADEVLIGDLEDLENASAGDCDLLITHSHGRQAAERLNIPFFRMGIPMFDRLGAGHLRFGRLSRHARPDVRHRQSVHGANRTNPIPTRWRLRRGG